MSSGIQSVQMVVNEYKLLNLSIREQTLTGGKKPVNGITEEMTEGGKDGGGYKCNECVPASER